MKKQNFYLLLLLGFTLLSLQFHQKEEVNELDKKVKEIITKTKVLELLVF